MRALLLLLVLTSWASVLAQFDVGGSFGSNLVDIRGRSSSGNEYARFSDIARPGWTASLFYREKVASHTNLGLELLWHRQEFHCYYFSGGLAGGEVSNVHVVLHTLNVAILPEVRLGASSEALIRFGVLGGFRVAGSKTGTWSSSGIWGSQVKYFRDSTPKEFGGDLRVVMGFGFRVPMGAHSAVTIDPYGAYGFSSMLKESPGSRTTEVGIRLGWSRRIAGGTLSQWVNKRTPTPPPGPNW